MMERRFENRRHAAEIRSSEDGKRTLHAYAAVFMRYSQNLGGFVEQIAPQAFDRVLGADQDTYALFNHDQNQILGRTLSGTLRVSKDVTGLPYEVDLPTLGAGPVVEEQVRLRNLTGSSFSFRTAADGDTWSLTEDGFPLRTVTSVARLFDVGPVTTPAYLQTHEEGAAAAMRSLSSRVGRNADELQEAALAGRLHELVAKELREGTPEKPAGLSPELVLARIDAERRRIRSLGR